MHRGSSPPRRPVVTVESETSAGVTVVARTAHERVEATASNAETAGAREGTLTASTIHAALNAADPNTGVLATAPWPIGTRRCVVKAPPRVFMPEKAPVRDGVQDVRTALASAANAPELSPLEPAADVLQIINRVRSDPPAFASVVKEAARSLIGRTLCTEGGMALKTNEGAEAYREAAEALVSAAPVPPLSYSCQPGDGGSPFPLFDLALLLAARDHAADIGVRGLVTHRSTVADSTVAERIANYGAAPGRATQLLTFALKSPLQIVLQLLVDDGDARRPMRKALLDARYTSAGCCVASHMGHGACSVIVLGSPLTASEAREHAGGVPDALALDIQAEQMNRVALMHHPDAPPTCDSSLEAVREAMLTEHRSVLHAALCPRKELEQCPACLAAVDLRRCVYGPRGRAYHPHCLQCNVCKSTLHGPYFISGSPLGASAALGRGAALPAPSSSLMTCIAQPTREQLILTDAALLPGQPHCATCYVFRFSPTCAKCGKRTVEADNAGLARAEDGTMGDAITERSVNGAKHCRDCYEDRTSMMATAVSR